MDTSNYMLIRGERIIKQLAESQELLEFSTAPQLDQNIRAAWPDTRKRQNATNEVSISNVEFVPYVGTKMLHVKSISNSNGNQYKQALQFTQVTFANQDSPNVVTFQAADGQDAHAEPITLATHNVKCRCNCMDFHFRFANYNSADKSLVGRPPPLYQRRTDTRPPVNPMQVPGMCKHLLKLVSTLRGQGLVV